MDENVHSFYGWLYQISAVEAVGDDGSIYINIPFISRELVRRALEAHGADFSGLSDEDIAQLGNSWLLTYCQDL